MKFKNCTIITARSKSSRYPNKILENINSKYKSIDILIQRSKKIGLPIILATSNLKADNILCNYVKKKYNVEIFRGSNKNKIERWYKCFKKYKISIACMVDGDDICFDYNLYKKYKNKNYFYGHKKNLITGVFLNIINFDSIFKIYEKSKNHIDTEMIEPFVKKSNIKKKIIISDKIYQNKKIRLTFDYLEDLKLFKIIFSKFSIVTETKKIVKFLSNKKKFLSINYFREKNWKANQIAKINKMK